MIRKTLWYHRFLLKFDCREGFHQPLLTYDAQITGCNKKVPPNSKVWVSIQTVLIIQHLGGTQKCPKNNLLTCAWDSSLQKNMKKATNQHARIPISAKLGHAI